MLYHLKGCTWKQGFVSMVWFCDIRAGRTFQCLPAILLACIHNLWLLHSSVCVSTPTCLLLAHTERRVVFLKLQHQPVKPSKRIILKGHNSDYFGKWSSFLLLPPSSAQYTEVQRVNMLCEFASRQKCCFLKWIWPFWVTAGSLCFMMFHEWDLLKTGFISGSNVFL